jgi:hypothetical protein
LKATALIESIYHCTDLRTVILDTTSILIAIAIGLAGLLLTDTLCTVGIDTLTPLEAIRVITADITPEPVIHTFTTLTIQRIFTIAIGSANISFIYALTNIQIAEEPLFTLFIYLALLPIAPIPLITLTIIAELIFITICI